MKKYIILLFTTLIVFSCDLSLFRDSDSIVKEPEVEQDSEIETDEDNENNSEPPPLPNINGVENVSVNKGPITISWDEEEGLNYSAELNGTGISTGTIVTDEDLYDFSLLVTDDNTGMSSSLYMQFIIDSNYDDTIKETNVTLSGNSVSLIFNKGNQFDSGMDPQYVIWAENEFGIFLQNLYVCVSPATNVMRGYAAKRANPQALPYWAHKACEERDYWISTVPDSGQFKSEGDLDAELDSLYLSIPSSEPDGPIPYDLDAVTGATIYTDFTIHSKLQNNGPEIRRILFEINRSYDSNNHYTSSNYPDKYFSGSEQPSLIYATDIDLSKAPYIYKLELIGAGHYAGRDGELHSVEYHTSALELAGPIYFIVN